MFRMELADSSAPADAWIGKDLNHAFDELGFYAAAKSLRDEVQWPLLDFMIEYGGALPDFPVRRDRDGEETRNLDLLVLRNITEGMLKPRLLDFKIGERTSAPNWMGKSSYRSLKQDVIDGHTNSATEGVRLEGFLNPPEWLLSEDPLQDVGGGSWWSCSSAKKAKRAKYQRMPTSDVLVALLDLRGCGDPADGLDGDAQPLAAGLPDAELSEAALLHVVGELRAIYEACGEVPVPQKWIGSSIALALEAGIAAPGSSTSAPGGGRGVRVRTFDWGRSELNTPSAHKALPAEAQEDRALFWALYVAGAGRLLWEATRLYWNSFCVAAWGTLRVAVHDYDSQTANEFLGLAEVPLPAPARGGKACEVLERALPLLSRSGAPVKGKGGRQSTVTLSARFVDPASPASTARFRGGWRVRVESAANLPVGDFTTSDAFAVVSVLEAAAAGAEAPGAGGGRRAQGRTAVVPSTLDPVWGEGLFFPVAHAPPPGEASTDAAGEAALWSAVAPGRAPGDLGAMLPAPQVLGSVGGGEQHEEAALARFLERASSEFRSPRG